MPTASDYSNYYKSAGDLSIAVSEALLQQQSNQSVDEYENSTGTSSLSPPPYNYGNDNDNGNNKNYNRYSVVSQSNSLASQSQSAASTARVVRIRKNNETILMLMENLERQRERFGNNESLEVASTLSVLAHQHSKRGEYTKALEFYFEVLQIRSQLQGEDHLDVATALQEMGRCKASIPLLDYAGAIEHYETALMIRGMHAYGDGTGISDTMQLATASLYSDMGRTRYLQMNDKNNGVAQDPSNNDFEQALECYQMALDIQKKVVQPSSSCDVAVTLLSIGDIYLKENQFEGALQSYQEALEIRLEKQDKNHVDVAECHHKVAVANWKMIEKDSNTKALESFSEALRIKKMRLGVNHVSVAETLSSLGKLKYEIGDLEIALVQFEEALDIRLMKVKDVHEEFAVLVELTKNKMSDAVKASMNDLSVALGCVAELYFLIGTIHEERSEDKLALASYSKALQMRSLQNGPDHEDSTAAKEKVAIMSFRLGRYDDALEAFSDILETKKKEDENGIDVANVLLYIARVLQAKGEQDKAMEHFKTSKKMKEEILGLDHEEVKEVMSEMKVSLFMVLIKAGHSYREEGDDYQAIKSYKQALSMRASLPDSIDDSVAISLFDNLASIYCSEVIHDMHDEALILSSESLSLKEKVYGATSIEAVQAYIKIGSIKKIKGDYDGALETFQGAMDKIKLNMGRDHAVFAEVMQHIGEVLTSKGEFAKAMRSLAEAIRIRDLLFGGKHPCYLDSVEAIGKIHHKMKKYDTAMEAYNDCLKDRLEILDKTRGDFAQTMVLDNKEKYREASVELLSVIGAVANVHHLMGLVKKDSGDIEGAFESFNNELEVLKLQLREGDLKLAAANEMIGVLYHEQGDSERAMELLMDSLKVKQLKLGRRHVEYANTLISIGHIHRSRGYNDEALRVYKEGVRVKETKSGSDKQGLHKILELIGDIYVEKGENKDAANAYMRSMEYLVEQSDSEDSIMTVLLQKLGDAYSEVEQYDLALQTYKQAFDRLTGTGSDEIPTDLLNKIADAHNARGEYMETMKVFIKLGRFYMDNEDTDNASSFFVKALQVKFVEIGETHLEVALSLDELGRVLRSKGQLDLALDAFKEALIIYKQMSHVEMKAISSALENVGDIYFEKDELENALSSFVEALDLRSQTDDKDSVDIALLREKLATLYLELGDDDEAMVCFNEVLRVKKLKMSGKNSHPSIAETTFIVGTLLRKKGQSDEAMLHFQEALSIKMKVNGSDHVTLAPIRAAIGDECMAMTPPDYMQARESYSESLRIWDSHGESHLNTVPVYFKLGSAQIKLEMFTDAVSSLSTCLNYRRETLDEGSYNKDLLMTLHTLAEALLACGDFKTSLVYLNECLKYSKDELSQKADAFKAVNVGSTLYNSMDKFNEAVYSLSDALGAVASIHYEMGLLYCKSGTAEDYEHALKCFTEGRNVRKLQRGDYHVDVAALTEAIGDTLTKTGDYDNAMNSFMEALRVRTVADKLSVDYAKTLCQIGRIYFLKGELENAMVNFKEALHIRVSSIESQISPDDEMKQNLAHNYCDIADVYLAQNDDMNALKEFENAMEVVGTLSVVDKKTSCYLLTKLGTLRNAVGEVEKAKFTFDSALELVKQSDGSFVKTVENASLVEKVANFYFSVRTFDEALNLYNIALAIRSEVADCQDPTISNVIVCIGRCYYKKRNAKKALEFYTNALEMRQAKMKEAYTAFKSSDDDSQARIKYAKLLRIRLHEAAESEHDLGILRRELKNHEEALNHFKGELGFRKLEVGDSHVDVANVMETVGTTQYMIGEIDNARKAFVDALEMKRVCLGEDSVEYATSLNNVGNLDFAQHEYDDALRAFLQALAIKMKKLGRDDITVGAIQNNIGSIYYMKGEYEHAVTAYEETLRIRRIKLGKCSDTAKSLQNLGDAYLKNSELGLALDTYYDAFEMYRVVRGESSLEVANALEGLANVCIAKGELEEAMENYLAAYEIKEPLLDEEHPSIAKTLENMGMVHNAKGELEQAMSVFQEVLRLKKLRLGDDSMEVALTWENLAEVLAKESLFDRAIRTYEISYKIKESKLGESMELAKLQETIGDIYLQSGNIDTALTTYYKAITKQRNILGKDHADLAVLTGKIDNLQKTK